MKTIDVLTIAGFFIVTVLFINLKHIRLSDKITQNHKETLAQIQKSIDKDTEFIEALNRAVNNNCEESNNLEVGDKLGGE